MPTESSPHTPLLVAPGLAVTLELVDETGAVETLTIEIVEDRLADFQAGLLGLNTPLARVLLGHPAGAALPYPQGDLREVRILSITLSQRGQGDNPAALRSEAYRAAVHQAELTQAIAYASSVDNKWGDYDPAGLAEDEVPPKPKKE